MGTNKNQITEKKTDMRLTAAVICTLLVFIMPVPVLAHFGMIIPSSSIVNPSDKRLTLTLSFSHPFEKTGMDMVRPQKLIMTDENNQIDLTERLQPTTVMTKKAWSLTTTIKKPGVYWFTMTPAPYFEAAEDIFILHLAKTAVAAFGAQSGWDKPLGLETEIIPLTRPFGNYAGNSFTGRVVVQGKPAPNTGVEVAYYNAAEAGQHTAPTQYHITQLVKTDDNGIFTFTCPWAGWWGFAALHDAPYTLPGPDGKEKQVELGAVLWLYMDAVGSQ